MALSRPTRAIGLIVLVVAMAVRAQDVPLRADVIAISDTAVDYVLTNHGTRTATAWSVEFTITDSAGQKRQSGLGQDNYATIALRELNAFSEPRVLEPNESRRETYQASTRRGVTTTSVDARVVGVVYDDGSGFGDAAWIAELFADRQASRDTYASLLADLRAAISQGGRPEDFEALVTHTQMRRKTYPSPAVADGHLQNLKNAKIRMGQGAIDAAGALQSLEMLMTLEHAAAAKHSVRAK